MIHEKGERGVGAERQKCSKALSASPVTPAVGRTLRPFCFIMAMYKQLDHHGNPEKRRQTYDLPVLVLEPRQTRPHDSWYEDWTKELFTAEGK